MSGFASRIGEDEYHARMDKAELDRAALILQRGPYEGYPPLEHRLFRSTPGFEVNADTVVVPDGPWHVHAHANRSGANAAVMDPEVPGDQPEVDAAPAERWRADGLTLDQLGRPLHPDWRDLVGDPRIGMPTGTGFFYRYGPNATVDPVVYRSWPGGEGGGGSPIEFLLIKRRRGGLWGLPGGFRDRADDSSIATAVRETAEETGLDVSDGSAEILLHIRPISARNTLHAWTENTVVLIKGDQDYLRETKPVAGDDAVGVGWFDRAGMARLDILPGHDDYIDAALERLAMGTA